MTIYQALQKSGIKFTKYDCARIGEAVAKLLKPKGRAKQTEKHGEKTLNTTVNYYDEQDAEVIYGAIVEYFSSPKPEPKAKGENRRQRKCIPPKK